MGRRGEEGGGVTPQQECPWSQVWLGGWAQPPENTAPALDPETRENLSLPALQQRGANGAHWPAPC